jgi:hypothetical protein
VASLRCEGGRVSARRIGERTLRSCASGRFRTRAPLTQEQITSYVLGSTVGCDGRAQRIWWARPYSGSARRTSGAIPDGVCAARGGVLSVTQVRANHNARRGRTVGDIVQQLRLWRSRPPAPALRHTLHRLAKRADRQFGRTHQGVSPVRQLLTLLDQPARGVPRVLRSPPYFRRNVRAGEEVLAKFAVRSARQRGHRCVRCSNRSAASSCCRRLWRHLQHSATT